MTRNKAKRAECEEHDDIRKEAQEWVTRANATNVERMQRESTVETPEIRSAVEADPIWEALVDCPITLRMSKLLNLVPQFWQAMEARLQAPHKTILTLLTETNLRPTIIDNQSPVIKVLVHGTEIQGCVIDGRSGRKRHQQSHM